MKAKSVCDYMQGGKDFTRGSAADVKKYIEGLLK